MASPPNLPKLYATTSDMPAGTSAVTPAGAAPGGSAGGSGIPFTPPPPLADLVDEKARWVPQGADTFLPRLHGDRTGLADQEHDPVTPPAMADLDTALSTFRESLMADISRVIAASPARSAQNAPRRDSPLDALKSRSKEKTRRHRSPSPSTSSTSSTSSPTTTNDDEDRVGTKAGSGKLAVLQCPEDRFTGVLHYRSYRLRNRRSTYGASQARKMRRTAKNMKFSFGGTPLFNGKEPLKVFLWLPIFVKACDDNDVSEGMGLYLIPNFLAGDAEARFTRNLPGSDIGGGQRALGAFLAAVNLLLSTYAEPHALGLAQDTFSRATMVDNEGMDAFALRLRSLAELCGSIYSEGTMKQQLSQGLPEYLRTDAFVYNAAQRSYQQLSTFGAGKYRAPNDVMPLANRGSPGGSSRKGQTSTGPRGLSVNDLNSTWEEDDTDTHDMVAVLPSGTPGFRTVGAAPYPRREATTGPPLFYMCWTRGHRVPDCKILTDKQRDIVKAARSTFLRQSNAGVGATPDRTTVVALLWDDLFGGAESTKTEGGDVAPVATPSKGRRGAGNA